MKTIFLSFYYIMRKTKNSRNKKINRINRTIKYKQYGGEEVPPVEDIDPVKRCEEFKNAIEAKQSKLTEALQNLVNGQLEMVKDPNTINNIELKNLKTVFTTTAQEVDKEMEKLENEVIKTWSNLQRKVQDGVDELKGNHTVEQQEEQPVLDEPETEY